MVRKNTTTKKTKRRVRRTQNGGFLPLLALGSAGGLGGLAKMFGRGQGGGNFGLMPGLYNKFSPTQMMLNMMNNKLGI